MTVLKPFFMAFYLKISICQFHYSLLQNLYLEQASGSCNDEKLKSFSCLTTQVKTALEIVTFSY